VMASASIPALFPPVYIPVEAGDQTYWQMHVDGGVREMVFGYEFREDLARVAGELGLERSELDGQVYLLHNGTLLATSTYLPVKASSLEIARTSVLTLIRTSSNASVYRVYVEALASGLDFHIAYIPREYDLELELQKFDTAAMQRLFEFGRTEAAAGRAWHTTRASEDIDETLRLLDPSRLRQAIEGRPDRRH